MHRRFHIASLLAIGALTINAATAQTLDIDRGKVVRFINPLGPGSGADIVTRMIADQYGQISGQPTITENKPGADAIIAVQSLLSSPPDGRTIMLLTPSAMVINPLTKANLPYAPKSIRPIAWATKTYSALVTGGTSPYKSVADVIEGARKSPGTLGFANYGQHYHLGALTLEKLTGTRFNHIAYKGATQANTDVIGRAVDVNLTDISGALPLIQSGKLRALAVAGEQRHPLIPDVPTFAEAGVRGFAQYVWIGFGIRGDTPDDVASKVETNVLKALNSKEFVEFNIKQWGTRTVVGTDGKSLQKNIDDETARYRDIVPLMQSK